MDYRKTAKEYADTYGVTDRTIKRWKAKGWPLDDEAATRLLIADGGAGDSEPRTPRQRGDGAKGLASAIARLQQAEIDAYASYVAAIDGDDEITAGRRLKEWTAICEQLRKTEQSTPEVEAANKNAVSLADLRPALTDLFQQLRQDLDALPRRVAKELAGADELKVREVLTRETGDLIGNLFDCKYLTEGGRR